MSSPLTAEDRGFIRAILDYPEELTGWLAYADWLDEQADPRAEFLRLTVERRRLEANDPAAEGFDARLAVLRETLDPNWMLVFDTPQVENCPASSGWAFRCPKTWDSLAPTDEPGIRICHDCKSPVFFCHSEEEARQFASAGQCVALSSRVPHTPRPEDEFEYVTLGIMRLPDEDEEPEPPPPPRRPWWKFW